MFFVNKAILFIMFVVLGAFAVLILNTKLSENKTTMTKNTLSVTQNNNPTDIPSPTQTEVLGQQIQTEAPTATQTAIIKTSKGDIELTLYTADAPNTVANFIQKAKSGFYNNLIFHRVEDWVIQGGDPLGNGTGGDKMPTELNNRPFVIGSLGVARGGDIKVSNDAQFFINKKDSQFLNGQYTNFGIVTKGIDVANKIEIGDKILGISAE